MLPREWAMFNPLLDPFPTEYKGYLIRSDFRIGVQMVLCAADTEITEYERIAIMCNLLYGNGMPDFETALKGINWFVSCGKETEESAAEEEEIFSFEHDAWRFVSAFRKAYGIDITKARMHWFEFVALIGDLSNTALATVMEIRQQDLTGMDQKTAQAYRKLKRKFALPNSYTPEEQTMIDDFLSKLNTPTKIEL